MMMVDVRVLVLIVLIEARDLYSRIFSMHIQVICSINKQLLYLLVTVTVICQRMFRKLSMVFRKKKPTCKAVNADMCHGDREYSNCSSATVDVCEQFIRIHGTSEVTSIAAAYSSTCLSGTK